MDWFESDDSINLISSQESEDGLYVCLSTFHGVGKKFLPFHLERTGSRLYLHLKKIRIEKAKSDDGKDEVPTKITKLAIGVEGGFQQDANSEILYEDIHSLIVYPSFVVIELNNPLIPEKVGALIIMINKLIIRLIVSLSLLTI